MAAETAAADAQAQADAAATAATDAQTAADQASQSNTADEAATAAIQAAQSASEAAAQSAADAQAAADRAAQGAADAAQSETIEDANLAAEATQASLEEAAKAASAAAQSAADAAAQAEIVAGIVANPAADPSVDPAADPSVDPASVPSVDPTTDPAPTAEEAAALAQATQETTAPDGTPIDPTAGLKVEAEVIDPNAVPIDAPEVSATEQDTLSTLLAAPADPSGEAAAPLAAPVDAPIAAGTPPAPLADQPVDTAAVASTTTVVTAETQRSAAQEFKAPPQEVAPGKKTGLSDLEKVGLFVLGAVVIGSVLNQGKKDGGQQVVSNTGDRVVVLNPNGTYSIYKDDDAVLRQPGATVRTETFKDGSTRTIVQREDGSQVVTIRNATGRVLRRSHYDARGFETVLVDDMQPEQVYVVRNLPVPPKRVIISTSDQDAALKAALAARQIDKLGRKFSLRQVRDIPEIRHMAAEIDVEKVNFATGSAAINPAEANDLADLGAIMQELVDKNPSEIFLIEGHTDATGAAAMNLALSDRRAESVALALTEYFGIPPENMVVQGYGESELRINTQKNEPRNRRVSVRIITPLLSQ